MSLERRMKRNKKSNFYHPDLVDEYLHYSQFRSLKCSLCGSLVLSVHDSHNPYPLGNYTFAAMENVKENPERCCSHCAYSRVFPARARMMSTAEGRAKFDRDWYRARKALLKVVAFNSKRTRVGTAAKHGK